MSAGDEDWARLAAFLGAAFFAAGLRAGAFFLFAAVLLARVRLAAAVFFAAGFFAGAFFLAVDELFGLARDELLAVRLGWGISSSC